MERSEAISKFLLLNRAEIIVRVISLRTHVCVETNSVSVRLLSSHVALRVEVLLIVLEILNRVCKSSIVFFFKFVGGLHSLNIVAMIRELESKIASLKSVHYCSFHKLNTQHASLRWPTE
jgi:hypothetical protein